MDPDVTRRVRHDPPRGSKRTGVDRNGNTIQTCTSCTKNWVMHADNDCLELTKNADKRKAGWKSYFM